MSSSDAQTAAPDAPAAPIVGASAPPAGSPGFGELIPPFKVASDRNPQFQSLSLGGGWIVLMFFGSLGLPVARAAHDRVVARRALLDDHRANFFGVSLDPADRAERGLKNSLPGLRYFWDFDMAVSKAFGLATPEGFTPMVYLLDRGMRIVATATIDHVDTVLDHLEASLKAEAAGPVEFGAPVMTVPRILEPDYCRQLVDYYDAIGGMTSGFMREIDGVTFPVLDDGMKRRRDVQIEDGPLRDHLCRAISFRLIPLIEQAFNWRATRIERYIVACYGSEDNGFFRPHRDNTTPATRHRKFAVSINLNDDYDGGDLRFPEYGRQTYRPPVGGATVFSCALLHEATPVTRGRRYATLPFLYDDAGRRLRDASESSLALGPPIRPGG